MPVLLWQAITTPYWQKLSRVTKIMICGYLDPLVAFSSKVHGMASHWYRCVVRRCLPKQAQLMDAYFVGAWTLLAQVFGSPIFKHTTHWGKNFDEGHVKVVCCLRHRCQLVAHRLAVRHACLLLRKLLPR